MISRLVRTAIRNAVSSLNLKIAAALIAIVFVSLPVAAQSKVDIELTLQLSRDTARGGEEVAFTANIRNIGAAKATDVILLSERYGSLSIVSAETSLGKCVPGRDARDGRFRCELGDISPGASATINGIIKVMDLDEPEDDRRRASAEAVPRAIFKYNPDAADDRVDLGSISVVADEPDDNRENNDADFRMKLLPSANRAPQVRILSPKNQGVLIRPSGSQSSYTVTIEASDVDGTVAEVRVNDPKHSPNPVGTDEKGYRFEYEGVVYSAADLEEYLKKNPPAERTATPTGKNTFSYTLTDPFYGPNQLSVVAVDNGGRESYASVLFFVKSDSTIEIVSPKPDQIFSPGSTITVETISRLKAGRLKDVIIAGDGIGYDPDEAVKMELVSRQGNVYRHRYLIKGAPANNVYSHVQVTLLEDAYAYTDAAVGYLVRELPKMSITSFKDGDVLKAADSIRVTCDIRDRDLITEYALFLDGKHLSTLESESINWLNPKLGKHTFQIVASFAKVELSRSPMITVTVE